MTPAAAAASPAAPPILTTPDVPASSAIDKPPPAMTCAPSATVSMPLPVVVPTDSSPVVEKLEPVPDTRAVAPCAIEPMVEIGRASCRERGCQYGEDSVGGVAVKKQKIKRG